MDSTSSQMDKAYLKYQQYPLVSNYFGKQLQILSEAYQNQPYDGRFYILSFNPTSLEERLIKLQNLGLTNALECIVREVGEVLDPVELDRRLMDAWAELRVLSLLLTEGFQEIRKVEQVADFIAFCGQQKHAFQVKRIKNSLKAKIARKSKTVNLDTFGKTIKDIHQDFDEVVGDFFWDALREKNSKYRSAEYDGWQRCIVIVSGDEDLQDAMVRHIACQQIRLGIHDPAMGNLNFENLLWLPDLSPGAWFKIGANLQQTRCFADWKDSPDEPGFGAENSVRKEVFLDRDYYGWLDAERIYRICP